MKTQSNVFISKNLLALICHRNFKLNKLRAIRKSEGRITRTVSKSVPTGLRVVVGELEEGIATRLLMEY